MVIPSNWTLIRIRKFQAGWPWIIPSSQSSNSLSLQGLKGNGVSDRRRRGRSCGRPGLRWWKQGFSPAVMCIPQNSHHFTTLSDGMSLKLDLIKASQRDSTGQVPKEGSCPLQPIKPWARQSFWAMTIGKPSWPSLDRAAKGDVWINGLV